MAKYSSTIEYNVKTHLDSSGLTQLQKQLSSIQRQFSELSTISALKVDKRQYAEAERQIGKLRTSLSKSFDTNIGMFNVDKFKKEMAQAKTSITQVRSALNLAGAEGKQAFNAMATQLATVNTHLKSTTVAAQKMMNTLSNTVRWGIAAGAFQTMRNSIGRAVEYVKELDKSLNDIRIVSGMTANEMRDFADQANRAAQAVGQTTTAYTNASLIYIQQGKTLQESAQLAELTLKAANVTGQETAEVSEQLTSLMNGYQLTVKETAQAVDAMAKVAAIGAADMEELATAQSKVASTANALGVSQERLISQLSTIISVTRQAPEILGIIELAA